MRTRRWAPRDCRRRVPACAPPRRRPRPPSRRFRRAASMGRRPRRGRVPPPSRCRTRTAARC
ncbi:MAG: hypothetical protein F4228_13040 [Acidobacteria bacterium]|nr:hypothetical protein [Acidobacteriota bacterium]MYF15616.1 hypothetical protein [Acidobacteriota bacterium]MYI97296.1 hypothetical protein [Acidobacteriota bacterium]